MVSPLLHGLRRPGDGYRLSGEGLPRQAGRLDRPHRQGNSGAGLVMDNYFIWQIQRVPHQCVLNAFTGVSKKYTLFQGIPLSKSFSPDAAFHMDPDFPKDLLLTDNMLNSD